MKVELESLYKLIFHSSVLLLMIEMSQSAREKLESVCKKKHIIIIRQIKVHHLIFFDSYWSRGDSVRPRRDTISP